MIDELFARDEFYSPVKPKWNKLADRLRRLKDDRDRIAHHPVYRKDEAASVFAETTLRPASMDIRQKSLKYKPMANDDISAFAQKVTTLATDLIDLAKLMRERSALQKKSAE